MYYDVSCVKDVVAIIQWNKSYLSTSTEIPQRRI